MSLLAPAGVDVVSQSGNVNLQAFGDVVFRSRGHNSQFLIDAGTILLPSIPSLSRKVKKYRLNFTPEFLNLYYAGTRP